MKGNKTGNLYFLFGEAVIGVAARLSSDILDSGVTLYGTCDWKVDNFCFV